METYLLDNWDITSPHQGAAVDGHYYAGKALACFQAAHNRSGLDGKSANLTVVVHDPETNSQGRNAHYADYGVLFNDDQLHVGDGGAGWMPLSAGFDVMAHELAHGVTNRTSGLVYRGESGALNGVFSDVMGAAAANWLPETRDGAKNVLIGERMTLDGRGIRNMADPIEDLGGGRVRDGLDHYNLMPACASPTDQNDHCGVHTTQLAIATTQGVESMTAVACAWFAVGVFDPVDLRIRNVACAGSNPSSASPRAARPATFATTVPPASRRRAMLLP